MSATTRPMPSRPGPARGCRPRPSGSTRAAGVPVRRATSSDAGWLPSAPADRRRRRRGRRASSSATVWEWTASRLPALSGLPSAGGCARRVQRQVHVQPDGAARRLLRHAARTIAGRPTATSSIPTSAGSSSAFGSRRIAHEPGQPAPGPTRSGCPGPLPRLSPDTRRPARRGPGGAGLPPKRLSPKFFYDRRGSQLFDAITELPEYYPTRTEIGILAEHGAEMADGSAAAGPDRARQRQQPQDPDPARGPGPERLRARGHLQGASAGVRRCAGAPLPGSVDRGGLRGLLGPLRAPLAPDWGDLAAFFPGSSIGNFDPAAAAGCCGGSRACSGPAGGS